MLTRVLPFLLLALPAMAGEFAPSPVATSIRGIGAVDAKVCWFGTVGGVARTTDGGENWVFTRIGDDSLDFRDLEAIDSQRCVAMSAGAGDASRIYLTGDGGKTWQLTCQNREAQGFFNGIAFKESAHGILAGDPIDGRLFLLATDDGGATWRRLAQDNAPQMKIDEHAFAASGTHLAVNQEGHIWVSSGGSVARLFHSTDWGRSWQTIETPLIAGLPSTGIFSIAFHGQNGMAVGGDYKKEGAGKANAMRTTDGGKSWQLVTAKDGAAPFSFRSCVAYLDAETLVVVGPSGADISRDAGATWQSALPTDGFHTMSVADGVVWVAGTSGRVGRLASAMIRGADGR